MNSHPDKVKLGVNDTMEAVEAHFVEITKAYKAYVHVDFPGDAIDTRVRLTDETIRQNWERYGHPDGRQEISMGIALPKTIVEGRNRTIVLAAYGLIFGGLLPALVGRWWFGNREKTKDGVSARSAATFFKGLGEDSSIDEVVASLGKSFEYERSHATGNPAVLDDLEKQIEAQLGSKWGSLKSLAEIVPKVDETRRRSFILLYAHLLRLPVQSSSLRKGMCFPAFVVEITHVNHSRRASSYLVANTNSAELSHQHCLGPELVHSHHRRHAPACIPSPSLTPGR